MRVPGAGREGKDRGVLVQGSHGHRRSRVEGEYHFVRAEGFAPEREAALRGESGGQEGFPQPGSEALHAGLQGCVRALLHPRGREGGDRRVGEEPAAGGGQRGSVEDDATPVRQHVVELDLVRAVVHGGQGEGAERGPRVADRLRERVQVQQRRLAGAEEREGFAG